MAKTNAQHQAATRARRSARIKRMEAALRELLRLSRSDQFIADWVVRRIATEALSPIPNERGP